MHKNILIILPFIESYTDDYVLKLNGQADYIICADGGQDLAKRLNIEPDVCIGDFDSTSIHDHFDCEYIRYPAEKDITDAEACLEHAIGQSAETITFLGGIGGRLDHTLGALSLLLEARDVDCLVELKDMRNRVTLLKPNSEITLKSGEYKYFGIISVYESISGLSIAGAKYTLDNATLSKASTLCISNEISGKAATISLSDGYAYIVQSNDKR